MQAHRKTRDQIAKAYDSPWWWYDLRGFSILTFAYRDTLWNQVAFFRKNLGPSHLEVAVGSGTLLDIILRWHQLRNGPETDIQAVDYAESMLDGARRRFAQRDSVHVRHADAAQLPYDDTSFDTVNIANALHALPEVEKSICEMKRVLRPGGTLAANILTYSRGPQPLRFIADRIATWAIKKGILVTPYEPADIRARFEAAGFLVAEERVTGNAYYIVAQKPNIESLQLTG